MQDIKVRHTEVRRFEERHVAVRHIEVSHIEYVVDCRPTLSVGRCSTAGRTHTACQ